MSRKKVGRPSKIDTETMKTANISCTIIVIILLLLLSLCVVTVVNPNIINMIKASIQNLFK